MAERQSKRTLLAMVKPPKPTSEMTEAEIDAFADALFELVAQRLAEDARGVTRSESRERLRMVAWRLTTGDISRTVEPREPPGPRRTTTWSGRWSAGGGEQQVRGRR